MPKTWDEIVAENNAVKEAVFYQIKKSFSDRTKGAPAQALYDIRYSNRRLFQDNPDKAEILEEFCKAYWGCSFDELMKLWDTYIG